jgi:hypothetical protein
MALTRCSIRFAGVKGSLEYDDGSPVKFSVDHQDPKVIEAVQSFFTEPRRFRVPESQEIDDYRVDFVPPVTARPYFEQALCVLEANTDVEVLPG